MKKKADQSEKSKMRLLNKELLDRFKEIGSQQDSEDPIVIARFFHILSPANWYATEYDPESKVFYGYVTLFGLGSPEDEWGSFGLDELEEVKAKGLGVERDLYFKEQKSSEIIK